MPRNIETDGNKAPLGEAGQNRQRTAAVQDKSRLLQLESKAAEDSRTPRRFAPTGAVGACASFWTAPALWRFFLAFLLCFLAPLRSSSADAPAISEAQGRALFVFNFVKYVEWPASAFALTNTPIIIGVVAGDEFADILRQTVAGKNVFGRALEVKIIAPDADPRGCQLLFIAGDAQKHAVALLGKITGQPILTVGESDRFLAAGGMVCLLKKENKLRPQIVLASAEQAGLKPSSRLLAVSEVLKSRPD